jgi:SAM-dependent methyltransferase
MSSHQLLQSPATARNRQPIADVLRDRLPAGAVVLEIASGSGEHAVFLARQLERVTWQPSDVDAEARASVDAWRRAETVEAVLPAVALDAAAEAWPIDRADAVVCINMVHISPWSATLGLLRGAGRILEPGGLLYLYGPYRIDGRPTAPSNESFDASLKARNPQWGLRRLEDVVAAAAAHCLRLEEVIDMPANNISILFRK